MNERTWYLHALCEVIRTHLLSLIQQALYLLRLLGELVGGEGLFGVGQRVEVVLEALIQVLSYLNMK